MELTDVIDVILEYVEPDCEIDADALLKQDCGLTSFDTTCAVGEMCDRWGVDADALDLRAVRTVGELFDALKRAKA